MSIAARQLFRDLVDIPPEERERILAGNGVPDEICAELESLFNYDSGPQESITRRVQAVAEVALSPVHESRPRYCGPYRLVRLLGYGGMGSVYLGERRDGEIEQTVAIKLLRTDAERPSWRDRFLRERQLLAYLNHPSIARLLDAGHTEDGQPYLAMEYVEGVAIDEYAAPLDLRSKLQLFLLVCDGVSHAHRHLIVHRDLKPSNILVDSFGHPKLLDFGIAKLLDEASDATCTIDRLLTPSYASPEQLRGEVQTTATDVYSLGAVLHHLLTGRSPQGSIGEPSAVSLSPDLPSDILCILRKALRPEPSARYTSVDALEDDIRAFLESKPVRARSGDAWYRMGKFLRRNRLAVAAATVAIASLLAGLFIANQQRAIAEKRFLLVRQLANRVLALDQAIGGLDTSSKARQEIATMSKEYLAALGSEARNDQNLALEVGDAYSLLARVQGISFNASSDQHAQAIDSLGRADSFVQPILRASPDNRKALLIAATISHHRMIIAAANYRRDETMAHARKSAGYLEQLLASNELSREEIAGGCQILNDISLAHKNSGRHQDAIHFARQSIEFARRLPDPHLQVGKGLSMLANLQRLTADLEGALETVREARTNLAMASFPSETARRSAWALVLSREAKILGAGSGLGLGRFDEAAVLFQKAFDLVEEWTQYDLGDTWSRMLFGTLGREFGELLRLRDPQKALAVFDHSLVRLREVKNSSEARRGEAEVLAESAHALRQLGRLGESRARIDAALRLLKDTNDYPADRVVPNEAADVVLRALGDHLADADSPQQGINAYENLLQKITAFKPDPQNDLTQANALSRLYASLATLNHRAGQRSRSQEFAALRIELWQHWDRKLPNNTLIRRQLESARVQ